MDSINEWDSSFEDLQRMTFCIYDADVFHYHSARAARKWVDAKSGLGVLRHGRNDWAVQAGMWKLGDGVDERSMALMDHPESWKSPRFMA